MANKKLKTIQFPGLPDTYTVPQVENGANNNVAALDGAGNVKDSAIEVSKVAKTDGSYQNLNAGTSDQLNATVGVTDKVPYNFRTAGGSADIGNRLNDKIVGGTICWNQMLDKSKYSSTTTLYGVTFTNNGDGTITVNGTATSNTEYVLLASTNNFGVVGHKYFLCGCPSGGSIDTYRISASISLDGEYKNEFSDDGTAGGNISRALSQGEIIHIEISIKSGYTANNLVFKPQLFDLTQMFDLTIADYIYSLEQATTGAGVAWFKKLFPKPYYKYNVGELINVCTNEHITRGFNAWDEEWELGAFDSNGTPVVNNSRIRSKNFNRCVESATYYSKVPYSVWYYFYDADKNFMSRIAIAANTTVVVPTNACYFKINPVTEYGTTYNHDICINLSWSGYRNGEYESYVEHRYSLSPIELRGITKLDSANNLYYDGDTYEKDGIVTRRYSIVDLGSLTWTLNTNVDDRNFYEAAVQNLVNVNNEDNVRRVICTHLLGVKASQRVKINDSICAISNQRLMANVSKTTYPTDASFKAAMSGVYLVYELATPTVETANSFTDPQIVNDFGTEEYVDALANAETNPRDVEVPVGHETFYQANLRDKLQNLPANANADGLYLVKQIGNKQELIAYTPESELPTSPAEIGTYVLKLVDGTLTWVLES